MKLVLPTLLSIAGATAAAPVAMPPHLREIVHEAGDALCDPNVKQYTGYFTLKTGGLLSKNYFYW